MLINLSVKEIEQYVFPGKEELLLAFEDETLLFLEEEIESVEYRIKRTERYLDYPPAKSYFEKSVHKVKSKILNSLYKHKGDNIKFIIYQKEPFYLYFVWVLESNNRIIGCSKSLDIKKTPIKIWNKLLSIPDA